MHLFYTPDIDTNPEMPEEEAGHCVRVLRLSVGDEVDLTDGRGHFHKAVISAATSKRCQVKVVSTEEQPPLWRGHLHIALAPTKHMERVEWFAEKATEIGFDRLTFLSCRFSERKVIKTERVEKIVVSAMKQSLKARKPVIDEITPFEQFVRQDFGKAGKFIAHCYPGEKILLRKALQPGCDAVVLIGPEGDFSPEEVELALSCGFTPISLGQSRLRTETAALVAVHLMNLAATEE